MSATNYHSQVNNGLLFQESNEDEEFWAYPTESELFDFDDAEGEDAGCITFLGCSLKAPIGSHTIGTKIAVIAIDLAFAEIRLWPCLDTEKPEIYSLHYRVGELKT